MIAHDPKTDAAVLVMNEEHGWDGSDAQLHQLQERFNTYASFLLDGEFAYYSRSVLWGEIVKDVSTPLDMTRWARQSPYPAPTGHPAFERSSGSSFSRFLVSCALLLAPR